MMIDHILIEKFLRNQCTEEEALRIVEYLEAHPHQLEELLPIELQDQIEEPFLLPVAKKQQLLAAILKQTKPVKNRRSLSTSLLVAASLLLVLGLAWWIGRTEDQDIPLRKGQASTAFTLVKINYGKEEMTLHIADGSVIYLKPGGEIRYLEQLSKNRDFKLKGTARFKVAEDKLRPFNVYAGGTVTTAVGTDFTVSSPAGEGRVSVLLHSGKVVVAPDSSINARRMKKIYLLPGNKLLIDKVNFGLTLIKNAERPSLPSKSSESKGQTVLSSTEVSFRNQSLAKIFNVLQGDFSADIRFDKAQVKGMYFTGTFKRNEQTVALILNEIAVLNHLNIEKRDSVYILTLQSSKQSTN